MYPLISVSVNICMRKEAWNDSDCQVIFCVDWFLFLAILKTQLCQGDLK